MPHLLEYVYHLRLYIDADAEEPLCAVDIQLPTKRDSAGPELVCEKYEGPSPAFFLLSIKSLGAAIEAEWLAHKAMNSATGFSPDLLQSVVAQIEHSFETWCQWERKGIVLIKSGKVERGMTSQMA